LIDCPPVILTIAHLPITLATRNETTRFAEYGEVVTSSRGLEGYSTYYAAAAEKKKKKD